MIEARDQLGRECRLLSPAKRIISLVPSQTELLADLGLDDEVIGITKFCIHPDEWFRKKQRIGGTKNIKHDLIRSLQPDLIIANKEENDEQQLLALMQEFNVWVSDIRTLDDALSMIGSVGKLCGVEQGASALSNKIRDKFAAFNPAPSLLKTCYLVWNDPVMIAGSDTFINAMMQYCGFINACKSPRYPVITPAELEAMQPGLLLLSSEPFPFSEKHVEHFRQIVPKAIVLPANGEYFSWYGSRLLRAPDYFNSLLGRLRLLQESGS